MQKVQNYRYLHRPFRLVWFESDELMILFIGLVLSLTISLLFLVITTVTVFFIRRFKNKYPRGFIRHISYFLGLYKFRKVPSFFDTHFNE